MKRVSQKAALLLVALVFVLTALLCFGGIPVYAAEAGEPITEQEIRETIAPRWIERWYGDETTLGEIVPVYGDKEKPVGYEADFEKNGQPNGYLMLNLYKNVGSAIPEFALDGEGVYAQLKNKAETSPDTVACGRKKLYRSEAFDYAIEVVKNHINKIYSDWDGIFEKSKLYVKLKSFYNQFKDDFTTTASSGYDAFHDLSSYFWWINGTVESYKLPNFNRNNYNLMKDFVPTSAPSGYHVNRGNCAPTAATNICNYLNAKRGGGFLLNDSVYDTYNRLASLVNFQKILTNAEPQEIGVSPEDMTEAIKEFGKSRNINIKVDKYLFNWYSDYRRDIKAGKAIYVSTRLNSEFAHAVMAYGCFEIAEKKSKMLMVLDGWYDNDDRYVDFNPTILTKILGRAIWIA